MEKGAAELVMNVLERLVWDDAGFVLMVGGGVDWHVVSLAVIRVVDQCVKSEQKVFGVGKTSCVDGVSSSIYPKSW